MPGETRSDISGWTVDTLKAHTEQLLEEMDRRYAQRFLATQEAITKAETAAEKRFDSVNEFRGQLTDQARTFMPRLESEQRMSTLDDKIAALTKICVGATLFAIAVITVVLLIIRK